MKMFFFFLSLIFFNVFNLIYFVVTALFSWPKASLKNLDENLALSSINNKQKTHLISGRRQLVVPSYHSLNKFKFLVFHTQGTYSAYICMYVWIGTHIVHCVDNQTYLPAARWNYMKLKLELECESQIACFWARLSQNNLQGA